MRPTFVEEARAAHASFAKKESAERKTLISDCPRRMVFRSWKDRRTCSGWQSQAIRQLKILIPALGSQTNTP